MGAMEKVIGEVIEAAAREVRVKHGTEDEAQWVEQVLTDRDIPSHAQTAVRGIINYLRENYEAVDGIGFNLGKDDFTFYARNEAHEDTWQNKPQYRCTILGRKPKPEPTAREQAVELLREMGERGAAVADALEADNG